MAKVHMIDPPEGWKFGFPKAVPDPQPENMIQWIIEQGYPQKLLESYGKHFYCSHWIHDTEHVHPLDPLEKDI